MPDISNIKTALKTIGAAIAGAGLSAAAHAQPMAADAKAPKPPSTDTLCAHFQLFSQDGQSARLRSHTFDIYDYHKRFASVQNADNIRKHADTPKKNSQLYDFFASCAKLGEFAEGIDVKRPAYSVDQILDIPIKCVHKSYEIYKTQDHDLAINHPVTIDIDAARNLQYTNNEIRAALALNAYINTSLPSAPELIQDDPAFDACAPSAPLSKSCWSATVEQASALASSLNTPENLSAGNLFLIADDRDHKIAKTYNAFCADVDKAAAEPGEQSLNHLQYCIQSAVLLGEKYQVLPYNRGKGITFDVAQGRRMAHHLQALLNTTQIGTATAAQHTAGPPTPQ